MDNRRRLKLVGISFAGVVFVAPLLAETVRNGNAATLFRGLGAIAGGLGLLGGTVLRRLGYVGHVGDGAAAVSGGLLTVTVFAGSSPEIVSFGGLCVAYGLANASLVVLPRPSPRVAAAAATVLGGGILAAAAGVVGAGTTHLIQIPGGIVGVFLLISGIAGVVWPGRLPEIEPTGEKQ